MSSPLSIESAFPDHPKAWNHIPSSEISSNDEDEPARVDSIESTDSYPMEDLKFPEAPLPVPPMESTPSEADPGFCLLPEQYEIESVLGRGGMGNVLLARDPDLGRKVAIKMLHSPVKSTARERFLREARVTGQLEHPNIVPLYEQHLNPPEGPPFLVLKRVKGHHLKEEIDRTAKGRPRAGLVPLLQIFLKVCEAVSYAHSRGVVHRDLKPSNVMIGQFGEVLLLDWGLARVTDRMKRSRSHSSIHDRSSTSIDANDDQLTHDGKLLGTPMYMAPEQAWGEARQIDERTDIYGLGAMLYQIVSLANPIGGDERDTILTRVRNGQILPPSRRSLAPWTVPGELETIILRAMAHEPSDRYASVDQLKAEIEEFLGGRMRRVISYEPLQRATEWVRRHRASVLAASVVVLCLLGFHEFRHIERTTEKELDQRTALMNALAHADSLVPRTTIEETLQEIARWGESPPPSSTAQITKTRSHRQQIETLYQIYRAWEEVLRLDPGHERALRERYDTLLLLGELARRTGELTLAEMSLVEAATMPLDNGVARMLLEEVRRTRRSEQQKRRSRIVTDQRSRSTDAPEEQLAPHPFPAHPSEPNPNKVTQTRRKR